MHRFVCDLNKTGDFYSDWTLADHQLPPPEPDLRHQGRGEIENPLRHPSTHFTGPLQPSWGFRTLVGGNDQAVVPRECWVRARKPDLDLWRLRLLCLAGSRKGVFL